MSEHLLNMNKMCDMLMLDEDSIKNLLIKFSLMLPDMMEEIKAAMDSKDVLLVNRLGHKLKGTAGNFRIDEMQDISAEINKIKDCNEEAYSILSRLRDCSNRLILEINEL